MAGNAESTGFCWNYTYSLANTIPTKFSLQETALQIP
jgi:hypothetical protein